MWLFIAFPCGLVCTDEASAPCHFLAHLVRHRVEPWVPTLSTDEHRAALDELLAVVCSVAQRSPPLALHAAMTGAGGAIATALGACTPHPIRSTGRDARTLCVSLWNRAHVSGGVSTQAPVSTFQRPQSVPRTHVPAIVR